MKKKEFGGGERGFAQLIGGIDPKEFRIYIATSPQGRFYQAIKETDAIIIPVSFGRKTAFKAIKLIMDNIRQHNIHIVHSQGTWADFLARIAGHFANVPAIISTVQMPVEGFDVSLWRKLIYKKLDRFSEKFVDRVIVVSDQLQNIVTHHHHIPKNKVVKIYNGIEIKHYSPNRDEWAKNQIKDEFHLDNGTILIGTIGRLVWQKGFEYLIRAIQPIQKEFPNLAQRANSVRAQFLLAFPSAENMRSALMKVMGEDMAAQLDKQLNSQLQSQILEQEYNFSKSI